MRDWLFILLVNVVEYLEQVCDIEVRSSLTNHYQLHDKQLRLVIIAGLDLGPIVLVQA